MTAMLSKAGKPILVVFAFVLIAVSIAGCPAPTNTYTLTTAVVNGHGVIGPASGPQSPNAVVALTATPDSGYSVKAWIGTDNDGSTANVNQVTMTGIKSVIVEFEPSQYTLTTAVAGGHGVLDPVSGPQTNDAVVALTATPDSGYKVQAWSGTDNDSSTADTNQVTMTGTKTVTVTFVALATGEEKTILLPGDEPLTMVWCPVGTFRMGRYLGELDSNPDEDLQHQIVFASGFWLGKYEVTQAQWKAIMGSNPAHFQGGTLGNTGDCPVETVSWNDVHTFITALNAAIGEQYRLPSEAEWEYACRAGTTTRFYWGDDTPYTAITAYAWFNGNSPLNRTLDAGGRLPNAWGLYDMSGNVSEWCEDDWHGNYAGAPTDGTVWADSPRNPQRVLRGGAANSFGIDCRSAARFGYPPSSAFSYTGFRLAKP